MTVFGTKMDRFVRSSPHSDARNAPRGVARATAGPQHRLGTLRRNVGKMPENTMCLRIVQTVQKECVSYG